MAHPLFSPEIRLMLDENSDAAMAELCDALHPATIAEALADRFTVEESWRLLSHTAIENQAVIFEYFPLETQVQMVAGTGRQHMADLIEAMSPDDRADLLRRLSQPVAEALLRLVDEADRRDIATLVKYEEDTAGALMTTDYAWLPDNITAGEALDRLRLQAPDKETIYYIYVVDGQRRLLGVVSLRDVILKPKQSLLRDFMETQMVTVKVTDDRETVANEMARYDLLAIPVVDGDGRLVGIVTHDDVMDVVVSEATEDLQRQAGVGLITENYLEARFFTVWQKRTVWLACLFLAELFTFTALSHFEDAIATVVVLSLFVPLCISTGGNSGSQAATLITRAMALGQVGVRDWARVLRHELRMGVVLGLTLGVIGFVRASFTPESVRSSSPPRNEPFQVRVPGSERLKVDGDNTVLLPADAAQTLANGTAVRVNLPEGEALPPPRMEGDDLVYQFPAKCTLRQRAVDRWRLALVIAAAVAGICLWGTLVGSMLPLAFRRVGVDPAMASSPFVATFVDVTGIVIYFNIARIVLADVLG